MTWKDDFIKYAEEKAPDEACGLVAIIEGKKIFWPCKNIAEDQFEFFALDPEDWAECEDNGGEILGVVHSHPVGSSEPSDGDRASSEYVGYPYHIYSIEHKSWSIVKPSGWKAPSLIGRKWVWGQQDCWTVICDWFKETKNIDIPYWNRPKSIKSFLNSPEFQYALPKLKFEKQKTTNNLKKGDVLLMVGPREKLSHVALYIGDQLILHHEANKLSCRELYDLGYIEATKEVYRYAA